MKYRHKIPDSEHPLSPYPSLSYIRSLLLFYISRSLSAPFVPVFQPAVSLPVLPLLSPCPYLDGDKETDRKLTSLSPSSPRFSLLSPGEISSGAKLTWKGNSCLIVSKLTILNLQGWTGLFNPLYRPNIGRISPNSKSST